MTLCYTHRSDTQPKERIYWPPELTAAQVEAAARAFNGRGQAVPVHSFTRLGERVNLAAMGSWGSIGAPTDAAQIIAARL